MLQVRPTVMLFWPDPGRMLLYFISRRGGKGSTAVSSHLPLKKEEIFIPHFASLWRN